MAGVCCGWLALRLSIYGRAGVVVQNWKNGLISIVILIGVLAVSLKLDPLVRAPAVDPIAVALAVAISMIVSDALEAPNQRWRSAYTRARTFEDNDVEFSVFIAVATCTLVVIFSPVRLKASPLSNWRISHLLITTLCPQVGRWIADHPDTDEKRVTKNQ